MLTWNTKKNQHFDKFLLQNLNIDLKNINFDLQTSILT